MQAIEQEYVDESINEYKKQLEEMMDPEFDPGCFVAIP